MDIAPDPLLTTYRKIINNFRRLYKNLKIMRSLLLIAAVVGLANGKLTHFTQLHLTFLNFRSRQSNNRFNFDYIFFTNSNLLKVSKSLNLTKLHLTELQVLTLLTQLHLTFLSFGILLSTLFIDRNSNFTFPKKL